ncbi:MAG: LamG-like jellyroll fold domain-containing protein, partial [Acidobacteriota bacterium]
MSVALPQGSFALHFRIRREQGHRDRSRWQAVAHKGASDQQRTPGLWLSPNDDFLYFSISTVRNANHFGRSANPLPRRWAEVIYSHDATAREVRLYIDGVLEAQLPYSDAIVYNDGPFYFGSDLQFDSFRGRLDDIAVYDEAIGPSFSWTHHEGSTSTLRTDGEPVGRAATSEDRLQLRSRESGLRVDSIGTLGSSTVRFQMRLWESPTGAFRSVAHKGATNEQRLPGLWMAQSSRHLLYAASTDRHWNEWGQSTVELPLCDWVDVAYVVDGPSRRVRLYLDGRLDREQTLNGNIVPNSGAFVFGRSPWYHAFRGEMDGIEVYDRPLAANAITRRTVPTTPPAYATQMQSKTRRTMATIRNYAAYYGPPAQNGTNLLPELSRYDMVIIESRLYTATQIQQLRDAGTIVIGYVSVGEQTAAERTATAAIRDWDYGGAARQNPAWGSTYVRPTAAWRQHVNDTLIRDVLARGCDGVFMDTLDTADLHQVRDPDNPNGFLFTATQLGVDAATLRAEFEAMVTAAHAAHPTALFVANRGFSLFPGIAPSLDAVLFESFTQPQMLRDEQVDDNQGDTAWTLSILNDVLTP